MIAMITISENNAGEGFPLSATMKKRKDSSCNCDSPPAAVENVPTVVITDTPFLE